LRYDRDSPFFYGRLDKIVAIGGMTCDGNK
jgi:hypothetical protein